MSRVEIAGPGFVNFFLDDGWLHDVLRQVVAEGTGGYARHDFGAAVAVNVEFVSANPTGPLHVGGGRWAAYGDALCNILVRCGYAAHREYYLNDRGRQMAAFAESLVARKQGAEPPPDGYHGDYVREWAAEMPAGADAAEWGYARACRDVAESLGRLGVSFDTWTSESALMDSGAVDATLATLEAAGAAYRADGAVWLRTAEGGDDKDRVLVRSGGEPTYLLPDIAYHADKFARGFDLVIDVWGADHHGYVERLAAGVSALGHRREQLEGGSRPTRHGDARRGRGQDLQAGREPGAAGRSGGPRRPRRHPYDVPASVPRQPPDHRFGRGGGSVHGEPRVLRAVRARQGLLAHGHRRRAGYRASAAGRGVVGGCSADARELEVLRALHALGDVVAEAARERAPHKLTTWVRELAGAFHGFYHDCPVLRSDIDPPRGGRPPLPGGGRPHRPGHRPRPAGRQRPRTDGHARRGRDVGDCQSDAADHLPRHAGERVRRAGAPFRHPGGPIRHPGGPIRHSGGPIRHSGGPIRHSGPPIRHSGAPIRHSGAPVRDSGAPVRHSEPPGPSFRRPDPSFRRPDPSFRRRACPGLGGRNPSARRPDPRCERVARKVLVGARHGRTSSPAPPSRQRRHRRQLGRLSVAGCDLVDLAGSSSARR